MIKFHITMMCGSCKWKISNELNDHGFKNFDIDLNTSILTFKDNVNPFTIMRIVSNIGYQIKQISDSEE